MFCDEVKVFFKAGDGGGSFYEVVRNNKRQYKINNRGKGGDGGGIILKVSNKINSLSEIRKTKHFKALNGENGNKMKKNGKYACDIIIMIPKGTQIISHDRKYIIYNFNQCNEKRKILRGGRGGVKDAFFLFPKKKLKKYYTKGEIGREIALWLILKVFASIGILGMPNIGKSTFLSNITLAEPKISNYEFTTIIPQLGFIRNYIMAEIPGICKNASLRYGLGTKFLKHLEKCKLILHVIDLSYKETLKSFRIIKKEVNVYFSIITKKELVMLSKADLTKYFILIKKKNRVEISINKEVVIYGSNIFHSYEKTINILYRKL